MIDLWTATDEQKLTLKDGDQVTAGGNVGTFRSLRTMTVRGKVKVATIHVDWQSQ